MSSSSLSEPPEELLSDAARGAGLLFALVAASVGEEEEEKNTAVFSENDVETSRSGRSGRSPLGLWFCLASWFAPPLPGSTGELHLGPVSVLEREGGGVLDMVWDS